MDKEYEDKDELKYVIGRAIKEGSVPIFLKENKVIKCDINEFVSDILIMNQKFMDKVDNDEITSYSTNDICEFVEEAIGYPTDQIEIILWFLECYQMENGFISIIAGCAKCGHDSLYYREGPDGIFSYYFECEKCKEKYDFEKIMDDIEGYGVIDFNEKLPLHEEIKIPQKDVNEVNTSYIIKAATGYRKAIWRKIRISAAATLDDLSGAVLRAFEFDDDHLYAFYLDQKLRTYNVPVYYSPRCGYSDHRSDTHMLEYFNFVPKQKFLFLYDFGAEWHFTMTIEKIIEEITPDAIVVQTRGESPIQYRYNDWDNDEDKDED